MAMSLVVILFERLDQLDGNPLELNPHFLDESDISCGGNYDSAIRINLA
jgi:hypothetical protein